MVDGLEAPKYIIILPGHPAICIPCANKKEVRYTLKQLFQEDGGIFIIYPVKDKRILTMEELDKYKEEKIIYDRMGSKI